MSTVQQHLDAHGMPALARDQAERHDREGVVRLHGIARRGGENRQRSVGIVRAGASQRSAGPLLSYGDGASAAPCYRWSSTVCATGDVMGATIVMPGTDVSSTHITERRRAELQKKFGTAAQRAEAILFLRRGRIAAAHAALSCNTWVQDKTFMRMWFEYCDLVRLDPTEFGVVKEDAQLKPSQLV